MVSRRGRFASLTTVTAIVWCLLIAWSPTAVAGLQQSDTEGSTAAPASETVEDSVDTTSSTIGGTVEDTTGAVEDAVDETAGSVEGPTDDLTDTVDGTVDDVTDTVDGTVDDVTDTVDGTTGGATEPITDTVDKVVDEGESLTGDGSGAGWTGVQRGTALDSRQDPSGTAVGSSPLPATGDTRLDPVSHWSFDPTEREAKPDRSVRGEASSTTAGLQAPLDAFAHALSPASAGLIEAFMPQDDPDDDRGGFAQVIERAAELTKQVAFPLVLAGIVAGFLALHNKLDRSDPKLALAPVDQDQEVLYFE